MPRTLPRSTRQVALYALLAIGLAIGASLYLRAHRLAPPPVPHTEAAAVYAKPRPLPAFALADDEGKRVGPEALRGRWSLLFFGYTHCPDACPATLAELAQVERALIDLPEAKRPVVWLVSVDPARDTPATLHTYVRFFDPGFRGLTGEPAAVERLTTALGIAVLVRREANGDYAVDHSAAILLVNPAGEVAAIFPAPHEVRRLAADYRAIVTFPTGSAARG